MASINTLVSDIYRQLNSKNWFTDDLAQRHGIEVARRLQAQFNNERVARLSLSQLGDKCPCALWHSIHKPELAEPLPPWAMNKYSYGHMIEAWAITLAIASGHTVEGEQDELTFDGVVGHRDCVIDGCIVDVKSTSSMGFKKFADKSIAHDDPFGYLAQLDGYLGGSRGDSLVRDKDRAYLLAIDKQLGHITLYEHRFREDFVRSRIEEYKAIISLPSAPRCNCKTVPDGKSGNVKLDTKASYSAFKHCCFPNLRTFVYASGPVYLTKVVRTPDVPELYRSSQPRLH